MSESSKEKEIGRNLTVVFYPSYYSSFNSFLRYFFSISDQCKKKVGLYYLESAKLARKHLNLQVAYPSLLSAQSSNLEEHSVELAWYLREKVSELPVRW